MTRERDAVDEDVRRDEEDDDGPDGWEIAEGGCCLLQLFAAVTSLALLVLVPTMM